MDRLRVGQSPRVLLERTSVQTRPNLFHQHRVIHGADEEVALRHLDHQQPMLGQNRETGLVPGSVDFSAQPAKQHGSLPVAGFGHQDKLGIVPGASHHEGEVVPHHLIQKPRSVDAGQTGQVLPRLEELPSLEDGLPPLGDRQMLQVVAQALHILDVQVDPDVIRRQLRAREQLVRGISAQRSGKGDAREGDAENEHEQMPHCNQSASRERDRVLGHFLVLYIRGRLRF